VNERLMSAVLWAAVFFESCSDDECDPDVAVKQLEQIAYELGRLSEQEQDEFRRFAQREAERDPRREMTTLISRLVDELLGDERLS
jgi:hypothetical protein